MPEPLVEELPGLKIRAGTPSLTGGLHIVQLNLSVQLLLQLEGHRTACRMRR